MGTFVFRLSTKNDLARFTALLDDYPVPPNWLTYYEETGKDTLVELIFKSAPKENEPLFSAFTKKGVELEEEVSDLSILEYKTAPNNIPDQIWVSCQNDLDELNRRKQKNYAFVDKKEYEIFQALVTGSPLEIPSSFFNDYTQTFIHDEKYSFSTKIVQDQHSQPISLLYIADINITPDGRLDIKKLEQICTKLSRCYIFSDKEKEQYKTFKNLVTAHPLNIPPSFFIDDAQIFIPNKAYYFSVEHNQTILHLYLANIEITTNGKLDIEVLKDKLTQLKENYHFTNKEEYHAFKILVTTHYLDIPSSSFDDKAQVFVLPQRNNFSTKLVRNKNNEPLFLLCFKNTIVARNGVLLQEKFNLVKAPLEAEAAYAQQRKQQQQHGSPQIKKKATKGVAKMIFHELFETVSSYMTSNEQPPSNGPKPYR